MPAIVFFKIGSTDLTPKVNIQEFKVNSSDVYETWTDGNFVTHREIIRTRISGTFDIGFSDRTELNGFLTLLANNRNANGYYPIQIYVNNLNTTESINAFIDPEGEASWDTKNGRQWLVLTLKVVER